MALFALPAGAQAALPDLVADAPDGVTLTEESVGGPLLRLLRFNGYVHNDGAGPVEVLGTGGVGGVMGAVSQLREGDTGLPLPTAQITFETTDGHNHFHLQRAARYSLWDRDGLAAVAPVMKVGFCLLDGQSRRDDAAPRRFTDGCRTGQPDADTVTMGVSAGWRDIYEHYLPFQYVDASSVQPGVYRLRAEVDPDGLIAESDEANVPADTEVTLPGWVARPAVRALAGSAVTFDLEADVVGPGGLGAPRYRIDEAPEHGTLDVAVGEWLTAPTVTYTPKPGSPGDEIAFSVRDGASPFPLSPARATVALGRGVAIAGAPQELTAGASVQLSAATVRGRAATWSLDGPGTLSATGLFTAPAEPGTARIRATVPGGAFDEVTVKVVEAPKQLPIPRVEAPLSPVQPPAPPRSDVPQVVAPQLSPLPPAATPPTIAGARARRIGPYVSVSVATGRAGSLRVALRRGGRTVRSCTIRAAAGRSYACRLRPPARGRGALSVVAVLTRADGGRIVRRIPLGA